MEGTKEFCSESELIFMHFILQTSKDLQKIQDPVLQQKFLIDKAYCVLDLLKARHDVARDSDHYSAKSTMAYRKLLESIRKSVDDIRDSISQVSLNGRVYTYTKIVETWHLKE